MGVHNLDSFFNPKRIALIGASINPNSVSGKVLANLVGGGFRGVVYPVNAQYEAVLGIQCYPDLKNLPNNPDLAVICTSSDKVPDFVNECGKNGILNIIIMSAGFKEIGEEGKKLEEKIKDYAKKFEGMRIMGPNCLGLIVPSLNLNISFASGMPRNGNIAFISQSGALCTSVLDWALEKKIGFSYFVSIGNAIDVDFSDFIDFFGEDEKTKSIILYIESVNQVPAQNQLLLIKQDDFLNRLKLQHRIRVRSLPKMRFMMQRLKEWVSQEYSISGIFLIVLK
jgi:acetyltransferase